MHGHYKAPECLACQATNSGLTKPCTTLWGPEWPLSGISALHQAVPLPISYVWALSEITWSAVTFPNTLCPMRPEMALIDGSMNCCTLDSSNVSRPLRTGRARQKQIERKARTKQIKRKSKESKAKTKHKQSEFKAIEHQNNPNRELCLYKPDRPIMILRLG